jgi:hypothetical protein
MQPFTHIRESVLYAWNDSPRLRRRVKLLTCPCLWYCYLSHSFGFHDCTGQRGRRRQENRNRIMSEVTQARRERALQRRKRSVSVDGGRMDIMFRKKKEAADQMQSALFRKLPVELRLNIYEFVLCEHDVMVVDPRLTTDNYDRKDYFKFRTGSGCSVSILRTCKRLQVNPHAPPRAQLISPPATAKPSPCSTHPTHLTSKATVASSSSPAPYHHPG